MASWDSVQSPGPPDLRPPKIDFSPLGDIPNAYRQGTEANRQEAIRSAFKGGLPRTDPNDPNSPVDYQAAANRLFQLGDYAGGTSLLNFAGGEKALTAAGAVKSPYDTGGAAPGGGGAVSGSMQPQQVAPQPQQSTGPQGPTENLTGPTTETTVGPAQPIPPGVSTAQAVDNVNRTGQVMSARPTIQGVSPARMFQATQAPPAAVAAAAAMVPPADRANPLGFVLRANDAADRIDNAIAAGKIYGKDLSALQKKAEGYRSDAAKVLDALAPTGPMKEAATSGATNLFEYEKKKARELDIQKADLANAETRWKGIQGSATLFEQARHYIDTAKSVLNQPETFTGFGGGPIQDINKFRAIYGDQRGAMYGEAIAKLNSMNVLATIGQMKTDADQSGTQSGRIFSGQVEEARKTAVNMDTSIGGNRFLAEVQGRLGDYAVHKRDLAIQYRAEHGGVLDENFDKALEADLKKHPIFTDQERKNPSLLGAPTSPYTDPGQVAAWAQKMGLRPGDAIRTPGGKLVHVPPFGGG